MTDTACGVGASARAAGARSRVLIVSPVPTHPSTAGNRVRIFRLAQAITRLGHHVEFAHVRREVGDAEAMSAWWGACYHGIEYQQATRSQRGLGERLKLKARRLFGKGLPVDAWYDPGVDSQLQQILQQGLFDTVIVEYVFMSKALLTVGHETLKVIDTHDVFANRNDRFSALGAAGNWFSTSKAQERKGLVRADQVIAIQENEARYFRQLQSKPVVTVGDIIDLPVLAALPADTQSPLEVLFVGSGNPSNVQAAQWLLDEVMPIVNQRVKNVRWTIVGGVANALKRCSSVEYFEFVASLEKFYTRSNVVVNPAQVGTGLKIKTVEALSYAKAVVATSVGAEGLESSWQSALKVEDSSADFAAAVIALLESKAAAVELGREGRHFVQRMNEQALQRLDAMLVGGVHRGSGS